MFLVIFETSFNIPSIGILDKGTSINDMTSIFHSFGPSSILLSPHPYFENCPKSQFRVPSPSGLTSFLDGS